MPAIPKVKDFMTLSPHTIGEDILLSEAIHRMRKTSVRHLPVLKGGKLVGILSDRDVKLALSVHPTATDLQVGDVMTEDACWVSANTPLDLVAELMFRQKLGCMVIRNEKGKVTGIFTATDAAKALTALLRNSPAKKRPVAKLTVGNRMQKAARL